MAAVPTALGQFVFTLKASGLRARKGMLNLREGLKRYQQEPLFPHVLAEIRSPLFSGSTGAERTLELGKVQNLRIAARVLDGVVVPAGSIFSFWRQLGRCSRRRGFTDGRQLQEGCLIPAVGGGLCQLSNSLYQALLKAGFEVLERHPHSQIIPGSAAEQGLDATIAWNYIDLRAKAKQAWQVSVRLTSTELVVSLRGREAAGRSRMLLPLADSRRSIDTERHSCVSCGETGCHREAGDFRVAGERAAFLLDEWWPEFASAVSDSPLLYAPLDGLRFRRANYKFPLASFSSPWFATRSTLWRSFRQRSLPSSGAKLQEVLLANSERLAREYARRLSPDVTHITTTVTLLPFLARLGVLGGRTYDVLMTRDSMRSIQEALDAASASNPSQKLLADFRAPSNLVSEEWGALVGAREIITPHAGIARSWPQARLIPWRSAPAIPFVPGKAILFPGPTAARKGAYEVREVARRLGLEVVLMGSELEGVDFWAGIPTRRVSRNDPWLDGVGVVLQPAWVEHKPLTLLRALASGCPVVATEACGLDGVTIVLAGDVEAMCTAVQNVLFGIK